ncbi:MAG: mechanosensitive ion channel, partial [Acidimicrobiia bacterium]
TVVLVLVGRHLARRLVHSNIETTDAAYRANKIINYVATAIFIITAAFIWFDAFSALPTYLGLLSAGIAIALADVLKNMVGWVYILSRKPFQVGDRIEVEGFKGDVVDVRLFRFSLMEIDGWVDAEQSTGRLVHVPNGIVFNKQVANYTEGFGFIWHEVPVLITFESDWKLAERLMLEVLERDAPDVEGSAGATIRATARRYSIRVGTLTPTVYLSVRDSGVLLTARYLVEARTRRGREDRLWRSILEVFAEHPNVELAYPTVRTYFGGPIQLDRG